MTVGYIFLGGVCRSASGSGTEIQNEPMVALLVGGGKKKTRLSRSKRSLSGGTDPGADLSVLIVPEG